VSSTPILSFKDTLTVDISSQRIASLYGGAVHGNFTLEVILKDASGHEFSGTRLSSSIPVDTLHPLKNLSTNADERTRTIENYIFSNALFPLENPSTWHQTLGSDNHHDSEFNAFDLNLNVDDGGQIVHAMAAGTISGIGFYAGGASHVDIRHEADVMIGGQMQHIVWISRYLHIAMKEATDSNGVKSYTMSYAGGSVTLTKDMYIEQGQIIGGVSNLGAESNHFHGDVHIVANGVQQDAIDFNPYLRDLGVGARADITAQGEKTLAWDENAHEWSYATLGLYYHRNLDGSKHFLAMTSGKEEVEWKTIPSVQLADGTQVSNYKAWIYIDPTGLVWEWKNGTWLSIHVL
jgi:hypothetical protein